MSYFRTSVAALKKLAQTGSYENIVGFLVIARHASGRAQAGYAPYTLSGAGVNSLRQKAGLSEEAARGAIESLKKLGLIREASPLAKQASFHARWELSQGELDLDLPHALTDPLKDGTESALRRLRKNPLTTYAESLNRLSDNELRLDAIILLLSLYQNTSMSAFGGISPHCIYRPWNLKSQTKKHGGVRWGAEPGADTTFEKYMAEILNIGVTKLDDFQRARFWNAWRVIKSSGLVYEAVALYDVSPINNRQAHIVCTLRINDHHASVSDPSLLKTLEESSGASFGYYTNQVNIRGEPEAMWLVLPNTRGSIVGIWRLRFRAQNQDAGIWIEREKHMIETIAQTVFSNSSQ